MTHNQVPSLKAVAEQQKTILITGVVRIVDQASVFIEENGPRFLERDSVFSKIRSCLVRVPGNSILPTALF